MQAGLGGGSADAAAVLRWAGETDPVAASRLGADVAFCDVGDPRGQGRQVGGGVRTAAEPGVRGPSASGESPDEEAAALRELVELVDEDRGG